PKSHIDIKNIDPVFALPLVTLLLPWKIFHSGSNHDSGLSTKCDRHINSNTEYENDSIKYGMPYFLVIKWVTWV
ncbi:4574_t:CDS:1, partial [Paraglomus occultum]